MSPDPSPSSPRPHRPRGRAASEAARGHVLLVEGDRDLRDGIADLLRLEGFEVVSVETGLDALLQLFTGEPLPDLVVFDDDGPGMGGAEFHALARKNPLAAGVPLVLLASRDVSGVGADRVFEKPCLPEALVAAVAAATAHRQH